MMKTQRSAIWIAGAMFALGVILNFWGSPLLQAATTIGLLLRNNPNLENGLVALWSFDNTTINFNYASRSASDLSGNGNALVDWGTAASSTVTTSAALTSNPGIGNQTWSVPADWASFSNKVQCIGSGGTGTSTAIHTRATSGGGGGAYTFATNITLTPGGTATYAIGASATTTTQTAAVGAARETYFNGSASSTASVSCNYGKIPSAANTGGTGGTAAQSTPTSNAFAGGAGGDGSVATGAGGSGGGGSAGPGGAGKGGGPGGSAAGRGGGGGGGSGGGQSAGGGTTSSATGGNSGNGALGTGGQTGGAGIGAGGTAGTGAGGAGGAGAATSAFAGGAGAIDQIFDSTHGSGGGGGGGGGTSGTTGVTGGQGQNGGTYGGGGGGGGAGGSTSGAQGAAGTGGQGIIYITYRPLASSTPTTIAGRIGQGVYFNGSREYYKLTPSPSSANVNQSSAFSVAAWVKADDLQSTRYIFNKEEGVANEFGYALYFDTTTDKFTFSVMKDGAATTSVTASSVAATSTWTHLVAESDGTNISLYMNGALQGSATAIGFTSATQSVAPIYVGAMYSTTKYFFGAMDDVRVYSRALPIDDITRLYHLGATTKIGTSIQTNANIQNGLVGYWTFDAGNIATNTAYDQSGSGYVATATPTSGALAAGATGGILLTRFSTAVTGTTYTIPSGTHYIVIKAWGGAGGSNIVRAGNMAVGGAGGYAAAFATTTGGQVLTVDVGGAGGTSGSGASGGGGYSRVSIGSSALVIAAGGGGSADDNCIVTCTDAGLGGGGGGTIGTDAVANLGTAGGKGGTQSAGGIGGVGTTTGAAGASLQGGSGANRTGTGGGGGGGTNGGGVGGSTVKNVVGGGGGGGGYFGGGGGGTASTSQLYSGGGGGGSSFISSLLIASSTVAGSSGVDSLTGSLPGNNNDPDLIPGNGIATTTGGAGEVAIRTVGFRTAPGRIGQGLLFTATSSLAVFADTKGSSLSGTFSVALWAQPKNGTAALGMLGSRGPSDNSFDMKFRSGNQIHGDIGNGTSWITTTADATFNYTAGQWYHVVYVVTPTTYTIYVNGAQVGSGSYASAAPLLYDTSHILQIGGSGSTLNTGANSNELFNGGIDDVRIYNRALSADDVTRIYHIGATTHIGITPTTIPNVSGSGLVADWSFDGSTINASTTADLTGSGVALNASTTAYRYYLNSVSGATTTFTVPSSVNTIRVKAWGAGGESSAASGGGGGYITGIIPVTPGETLNVMVGGGGGTANDVIFGGGGQNTLHGGGYSGLQRGTTELITAGAGGGTGGTAGVNGGPGGGASGTAGTNGSGSGGGGGGTQTAGGAAGSPSPAAGTPLPGASLVGGGHVCPCTNVGGSGGAGHFGGGAAGDSNTGGGQGAGGGGSSYIISTATATTTISGSGATPGNSTDPDLVSGNAAAGTTGGDGEVVIYISKLQTTVGVIGQAAYFASTSDTVLTASASVGSVQSVAFWMKASNLSTSVLQLASGVTIKLVGGTVTTAGFTSPTIYVDGAVSSTIPDTKWHHVVITTGTPVTANAVTLGGVGTLYLKGALDDFRLYNRVLSAIEAKGLYQAAK